MAEDKDPKSMKLGEIVEEIITLSNIDLLEKVLPLSREYATQHPYMYDKEGRQQRQENLYEELNKRER